MENEIWYIKFLGGYCPCHWKGLAFQFFIIFFGLGQFVLLEYFGEFVRIDLTAVAIFFIFPLIAYNFVVIRRHS